MDLIRYKDDPNWLSFLDLDEIDSASYSEATHTLKYSLKSGKVFSHREPESHRYLTGIYADRIAQVLILKSRLLPDVRTKAES